VPTVADLDPYSTTAELLPPLLGLLAAAIVAVPALRFRTPVWSGVGAGLFAAFTVLVLRCALHGTPYAYEGVFGDTGRMSAMATRYTVAWMPVDGLGTGVASEYPPLFPWLIGKTATLLGEPAWRLLAPAEIIAMAGSVLVGFALWIRLVRAPVAAVLSTVPLLALNVPNKAYEVLALAVTVPWLILTVAEPPAGRLRWLPAGIIGGLLILTYYAYIVFSAPGVLFLAVFVWRRSSDRRGYLLHLLRVGGISLLIGAWFLVPYAWGLSHGGTETSDTYHPAWAADALTPFLHPTTPALLQLAGLIGLLVHRRKWWSGPLLALTAGCYVYVGLNVIRDELTGHTGLWYYASFVISAVLLTGAVLSIAEYLPGLMRRRAFAGPAAALAAIVLAALLFYPSNQPALAPSARVSYPHLTTLPDGRKPRYFTSAARTLTAPATADFPVAQLVATVSAALGKNTMPHVLSCDEAIFAFVPWRGYLGTDRGAGNALQEWDLRLAELTRLATAPDLAVAADRTRFGPIEVFVLHREGVDLVWRSLQGHVVRFRPEAFDRGHWQVADLSAGYVVAIKRG